MKPSSQLTESIKNLGDETKVGNMHESAESYLSVTMQWRLDGEFPTLIHLFSRVRHECYVLYGGSNPDDLKCTLSET